MKKTSATFFFMSLIFLFNGTIAFGWEGETHREMTSQAIKSRRFWNLDSFLIDDLGFSRGLDTMIDGKTVLDWIGDGSVVEDIPFLRPFNHFHDPTKAVSDGGLYDWIGWTRGVSAVEWARDFPWNEWNYQRLKGYCYSALTSETPEVRIKEFADLFQTVGRLLHLLQDMAAPAHTRNDSSKGHSSALKGRWPFFTNALEKYLEKHLEYITPVPAITVPTFPTFPEYFDTTAYRLGGFVPVGGQTVGLAEYSNSNFVSEGTMFTDYLESWHANYFPHPSLEDVYYWFEGKNGKQLYPHAVGLIPELYYKFYVGVSSPNLDQNIPHLACGRYFLKYLMKITAKQKAKTLGLDNSCYHEHAGKLAPKAVAYSAGLLKFIFRGDLDFEYNDWTNEITITNQSDYTMSGEFSLYWDDDSGGRFPLPGGNWQATIGPGGFITSPFYFPRKVGSNNSLTLVFRGDYLDSRNLPVESDAVAGKTEKFGRFQFDYTIAPKFLDLQYPEINSDFGWCYSCDSDSLYRYLYYFLGLDYESVPTNSSIARETEWKLKLKATPGICKLIGKNCFDGQWLWLFTNTYFHETSGSCDIVEYLKVEVEAGKWEWVYDCAGEHPAGFFDIASPRFSQGLWGTSWFQDYYYNLPLRTNYDWEKDLYRCSMASIIGDSPGVSVALVYPWNSQTGEYESPCENDDWLFQRAADYYSGYIGYYNQILAVNQEFLPVIYDNEWRKFGFEIKLNQLKISGVTDRRSVVYEGPLILYKPYGSDLLMVKRPEGQ